MNFEQIKKHANAILRNFWMHLHRIQKKTSEQLAEILKTICAYWNNYYDNDIQYIFIGVEERNDENAKSIPILPIIDIDEGVLEKSKNQINSLRPYLYPKCIIWHSCKWIRRTEVLTCNSTKTNRWSFHG